MSCRDRKAALDPLAARDSQPRISDCRKNLQDVLQGVLRCPKVSMFHHVSCNVHYDKHDKCVCVCADLFGYLIMWDRLDINVISRRTQTSFPFMFLPVDNLDLLLHPHDSWLSEKTPNSSVMLLSSRNIIEISHVVPDLWVICALQAICNAIPPDVFERWCTRM